ncbi:MAG: ribonuclease P protein component [Gammaproteobacteria bacterium]
MNASGQTQHLRYPGKKQLRSDAEFQRILGHEPQKPFRLFLSLFKISYRISRHPDTRARLGIRLSKRHIARAVDRSRVRRHIREAFRAKPLWGFDCIVQSRRNNAKTCNLSPYLHTITAKLLQKQLQKAMHTIQLRMCSDA